MEPFTQRSLVGPHHVRDRFESVCLSLDVNPCISNPCLHGGECANVDLGKGMWVYSCNCPRRYRGVDCQIGEQVEFDTPFQKTSSFDCAALSHSSKNASLKMLSVADTDPCASDPCQNAGTCSNVDSGDGFTYNCTCPEFYTGTNCENSGKIKKIAP